MIWPVLSGTGWSADPWAAMYRMHRDMDRLLGSVAERTDAGPAVNIWADENGATLVAAVPGVDPKEVEITVEGHILTLRGERKAEAGEGVTWHRSERSLGVFCRRIRLPYEVEVEKVKARGERGLLRIDLPRREASKPQRISVSAA